MTASGYVAAVWLAAVNLLLFFGMRRDKRAARCGAQRTPETTLLTLAVLGGSIGGIAGMLCFRHKTRKNAFRVGMPLILLCQIALAAFLLSR